MISLQNWGYGVPQDYQKAREWFVRAAENGNEDVRIRITDIDELIAAKKTNPLVDTEWRCYYYEDGRQRFYKLKFGVNTVDAARSVIERDSREYTLYF